MAKVALVEAITMAMAYEMQADPSVVVLGEDVGKNGGVFRATLGLQDKFGPERVIDTPLAEALIAGVSIGMAAMGLKPVAEIQFSGFIYPCVDEIINHAGRLRSRTRGRISVPMVLRAPSGGGIHAPEHHSESNEALFAHMPGIRVVMPSSPQRAYGLLLAAIRDPDPVIFLEPTRLYRLNKQEVADDGQALPLDTCFVLREGTDVTLVTWGAMVVESLAAAELMAKEGVSVEVIDLATVSPIDEQTILESVEKTGRCVIVQEAPITGGVGSEVAALVASKALYSLESPIVRVAGWDTPMPLFKLEHDYMPSIARVFDGIKAAMEG
jgi:2-oxoisovalerate dehydrogenase E1 component beta subunit